jgi:hypothetical protein
VLVGPFSAIGICFEHVELCAVLVEKLTAAGSWTNGLTPYPASEARARLVPLGSG